MYSPVYLLSCTYCLLNVLYLCPLFLCWALSWGVLGEKLLLRPVFADEAGWYKTTQTFSQSLSQPPSPSHTTTDAPFSFKLPLRARGWYAVFMWVSIFISHASTFEETIVWCLISKRAQLSHCLIQTHCYGQFSLRLCLRWKNNLAKLTDILESLMAEWWFKC